MASLTIAIVARNAEPTIARAVASCVSEPGCPILLVDDHSRDDTVGRAKAIAGDRITVLGAPEPGGVATARQCGLEAIATGYTAWLDADDEWIPGRAARLTALLDRGADVAVDAIELHDGPTGRWLKTMSAPACLRTPAGALRLFERNLLPGDTQVGFRTEVFRRAGGYDPAINGPESFDILLRAIRRGARFGFSDEVGYRMYAYPSSLSRNLPRQRAALADVLRKHGYDDVRRCYAAAGVADRLTAWALVSMAQFRGEFGRALEWLEQASPASSDPHEVLEEEGPWPFPEGWRRAFHRGTLLLMRGRSDEEAAAALQDAERLLPTPEGANNLGVALHRLGRTEEARRAFTTAASRWPDYRDALLNLNDRGARYVTSHPLRRQASRMDYALVAR